MATNVIPLPPPDPELLKRALTLAEASRWESDQLKAHALREQAMILWAEAHQARREALYRRGRVAINLGSLRN
jgi:hypothetical protein